MPTAVDVFCGGGGSGLGLERAGFKVILALDFDRIKCDTYKANFPDTEVVQADAMEFDEFPSADLYSMSPPCKDISTANTFNKNIERGMKLVRRSIEILERVKPKWHWIENVLPLRNYLKMKHYVLNAADYGVPQIRKRVFFTNIPRPKPTHAKIPTYEFFSEKPKPQWVSVVDVLPNLKGYLQDAGTSNLTMKEIQEPSYTIQSHMTNRLAWKYANEYFADWRTRSVDQPSPAINSMGRGGSLRLITDPSYTITTREGHAGNGRDKRKAGRLLGRKLEPEECALLQGFPKEFKFLGNKSQRYLAIGDAVPPAVAEALARSALDHV